MSGVYIKGMEMPTCGATMVLILPNGYVCGMKYGSEKWELLGQATELPPHGRCIDADALAKRIKDEGQNQAEYYADRYAPVVMAYGDCYGKVQSAPTIIPAEEGET